MLKRIKLSGNRKRTKAFSATESLNHDLKILKSGFHPVIWQIKVKTGLVYNVPDLAAILLEIEGLIAQAGDIK